MLPPREPDTRLPANIWSREGIPACGHRPGRDPAAPTCRSDPHRTARDWRPAAGPRLPPSPRARRRVLTREGGAGRAGGSARLRDPLGARRAHGLALHSAGPSPGRGAGLRAGQSACGEAGAGPGRAGRGGDAPDTRAHSTRRRWGAGGRGRKGGGRRRNGLRVARAGPRPRAETGAPRPGTGRAGESRAGKLPANRARMRCVRAASAHPPGTMGPNKGFSALPRGEPCPSLTQESEAGRGRPCSGKPPPVAQRPGRCSAPRPRPFRCPILDLPPPKLLVLYPFCTPYVGLEKVSQFLFLAEGTRHPASRGNASRPLT